MPGLKAGYDRHLIFRVSLEPVGRGINSHSDAVFRERVGAGVSRGSPEQASGQGPAKARRRAAGADESRGLTSIAPLAVPPSLCRSQSSHLDIGNCLGDLCEHQPADS